MNEEQRELPRILNTDPICKLSIADSPYVTASALLHEVRLQDVESHTLKCDLRETALPNVNRSQIESVVPMPQRDRSDRLLPTLEKLSRLSNAVDLKISEVDKQLPIVDTLRTDKFDPDLKTSQIEVF
jgi:hypothetical protein